jgi:hypothetical protein
MKIINKKGCLTKKPKILLKFQMFLISTSQVSNVAKHFLDKSYQTDFQMWPPLINTLFKTNTKTLLEKQNTIHNTLQKIKHNTF